MLDLKDVPEELQRQLFLELAKKFRQRNSYRVSREKKVSAAARILRSLDGYSVPQQRQILLFAIDMLETANKRFWRGPSEGKGRKEDKGESL